MAETSWAEITQCVGPWTGGGPMTMAYDIWILGAGMDPYNVLTCICQRCGERWSFDSPTSECRACERETLVEYLMDESRTHRREPPLFRNPPRRPKREVVVAPGFVESYANLAGTDETSAAKHLREIGLYEQRARPTPEDKEDVALRRYVKEHLGCELVALPAEKQGAWRKWWSTRKDADE